MNKSAGPTPTMTDAEIAAWVEMALTRALRVALADGRGTTYANELARRAAGKGAQ